MSPGRFQGHAQNQGRFCITIDPDHPVTSYALSGEEKKAREAGCDDYVPKPFSPRQLLAKIKPIPVLSAALIPFCLSPSELDMRLRPHI
jgi:response regulator RpfG family c-di-GMP phosphodiesterase